MNGPQDLGGAHGFGPVHPEPGEPLFHEAWEKRAFALTLAMGFTGTWTLDTSRHARERIPPADYLRFGYYRIWFEGLLKMLKEHDLASAEEIASGNNSELPKALSRKLLAEDVAMKLAAGGPTERDAGTRPAFGPGDTIRARIMSAKGHTRLPRYVRGATGTIERIHGCHVYPDTNAHGGGENPQWLYGVGFDAAQLWGEDRRGDTVHLDLWEPYLERA